MVRLIGLRHPNILLNSSFQFQNGSINSITTISGDNWLGRFNSKMVRLIGEFAYKKYKRDIKFQFQNGSINSYCLSIHLE